jgi:hypothetical protein
MDVSHFVRICSRPDVINPTTISAKFQAGQNLHSSKLHGSRYWTSLNKPRRNLTYINSPIPQARKKSSSALRQDATSRRSTCDPGHPSVSAMASQNLHLYDRNVLCTVYPHWKRITSGQDMDVHADNLHRILRAAPTLAACLTASALPFHAGGRSS